MTKIVEGQFSPTPSRPHTGFLGILIKHREQLEPGNKITGNAAGHLLALSRAIIEALGGKQVDGQWEVEIGGSSTVNLVSEDLTDMIKEMSRVLDRVEHRLNTIEATRTDVGLVLAGKRESIPDPRIEAIEHQNVELQSTVHVPVLRLADAEGTIERLAADLSRVEAKPVPGRPGRPGRTLESLRPIGILPKLATEKS